MSCPFCIIDKSKYIAENAHFFAIFDRFPVAKGHTLIISKRHCKDYYELSENEASSLNLLCRDVRQILMQQHQALAFNLAMNCGKEAGQSVFHFHMHVIPRYAKDKPSPRQRLRESMF